MEDLTLEQQAAIKQLRSTCELAGKTPDPDSHRVLLERARESAKECMRLGIDSLMVHEAIMKFGIPLNP